MYVYLFTSTITFRIDLKWIQILYFHSVIELALDTTALLSADEMRIVLEFVYVTQYGCGSHGNFHIRIKFSTIISHVYSHPFSRFMSNFLYRFRWVWVFFRFTRSWIWGKTGKTNFIKEIYKIILTLTIIKIYKSTVGHSAMCLCAIELFAKFKIAWLYFKRLYAEFSLVDFWKHKH